MMRLGASRDRRSTDAKEARALTLNGENAHVYVIGAGPADNGRVARKMRPLEARWRR